MSKKKRLHWTTWLLAILLVSVVALTVNEKITKQQDTLEERVVMLVNQKFKTTDAFYVQEISENKHEVMTGGKTYYAYLARDQSSLQLRFVKSMTRIVE